MMYLKENTNINQRILEDYKKCVIINYMLNSSKGDSHMIALSIIYGL